ncbi:MAG: Rid family detoxifying hydrolase [Bacteroidales bacterium]|nr:Rid family detoxifying hydrolase [Candidatus Sodaliphilus aphodohippi]
MKQKITANHAPIEIGAYSNAIKCGNMIFVSAQLPVDPETGAVPPTIQEQTKLVIENVRNILADVGATLDDVVKTTVYLQEMYLFSQMNAVYAQEFSEPFPARSSMAVKELAKGSLISLEVIAVLEE